MQLVRQRRIGIERGEVPAVPLGVQHRKPGGARGVEAPGCDRGQRARGGPFAVLPVHVEQRGDRRAVRSAAPGDARLGGTSWPAARQHGLQAGTYGCRPPRADARHGRESPVVRGKLESFQRVDVQLVVDALGQPMPESGHRGQQRYRVRAAAQAFELHPASGACHLEQRRGDAVPDSRQRLEARHALPFGQGREVFGQVAHRIGRPPIGRDAKRIGTLGLEQAGGFPQALCTECILIVHGDQATSSGPLSGCSSCRTRASARQASVVVKIPTSLSPRVTSAEPTCRSAIVDATSCSVVPASTT